MTQVHLRMVNSFVYSVHLTSGEHVGNLKQVGAIWKFKAIGYDADGSVLPGGGPLTHRHNVVVTEPDAFQLGAQLGDATL